MRKTDPLKSLRRKVAAAERALSKSREAMFGAAKQAGLDTAGIFAETEFVLRTTGEAWARDARREAQDRAHEQAIDLIHLLRALSDPTMVSPFAHLANATPNVGATAPGNTTSLTERRSQDQPPSKSVT